jgi:hypothetical protein
VLLALLVVVGWAGSHVVLTTGLLKKWVNTDPEKLYLDYESASSWVPGRIRMRGLTMRGSDPNVQWHFRMERATISFSLLDLLRKRFHARTVLAEGLTFRLRQKVKKEELSKAHEKRIPEIPGFSDPPWKIPEPEPAPLSAKEKKRFWTVYIENLLADPTPDLWVELYRFRGHARVRGAFLLHPHNEAWIGPASVEFLTGRFELGPSETILASATGRVDGRFDTFAQDEVRGEEIWRKISGAVRIEGRPEDLRFLNHFLRGATEPRMSGGGGKARFEVKFDHGIGKGSGDFTIPHASLRYPDGATVTGRVSGKLAVPRWDAEKGDMEVSGTRIELTNVAREGTRRDQRDWWGRFEIPSGRFHDGLSAQAVVACRDARPLYTLFNATLPNWAEGILKLEGLNAKARVRIASQLLEVENLEAAGGSFHIAGNYREKKDDRRGAFLVETGILAVGVSIAGNESHVKLLGAKTWFEKEGRGALQARAASTTTAVP